ncbi:MAG: ATP-binding protein, partial [Myxococcota bacterium]
LLYARSHAADVPFIDPHALELQLRLSYLVLAMWVLLGLASVILRRRHGGLRFFEHAPVQLFSISNSLFAYLMGALTVPYGPVVLIGGILASLPLFGAKTTLLGAASWLLVSLIMVSLEQSGVIPYGPLFRELPVVDGHLSPLYLIGMGSFTVLGILLAGLFSFVAIIQLQARDRHLRLNQEEMLVTLDKLHLRNAEIAQSHEALESRVQARTLELRTANERLRAEVIQRKQAGQELNRVRVAMEAAIEGVARVRADGRFAEVNAAFATMHRTETSAMMGTLADDWIDPVDRAVLAEAVEDLEPRAKREFTILGLRPDGSRFSQLLSLVGDPYGKTSEHHRFGRDITEQQELTAQLNHATKMEAIGRLAGGIAHDFNNLLMAIITASEQLELQFEQVPEQSGALDLATTTRMAATRAAALTRQLLDFARLEPASSEPIDIHRSIENSIHLLEPTLNASIRVIREFDSEPLSTRGDISRFDSGLLNIALNGRDAMPDGGELQISTRKVRLDPEDPRFSGANLRGTDFVRIDVTDTGIGIETENLGKIFDPFFTTKPLGEGTGLGLSVFHQYIHEIGGSLRVESTPGRGTRCSIYVPLNEGESSDELVAPDSQRLEGVETLLVAEDEPAVMKTLTLMLSRSGYSVIPCRDGREAVASFEANSARVAAAILDYRMPLMNGAEVFHEFQRIAPDVPVILMSGNLSDPDLEALEAQGLKAVLAKPCARVDLLGMLRRVLDAR